MKRLLGGEGAECYLSSSSWLVLINFEHRRPSGRHSPRVFFPGFEAPLSSGGEGCHVGVRAAEPLRSRGGGLLIRLWGVSPGKSWRGGWPDLPVLGVFLRGRHSLLKVGQSSRFSVIVCPLSGGVGETSCWVGLGGGGGCVWCGGGWVNFGRGKKGRVQRIMTQQVWWEIRPGVKEKY